MNCSKYNAHVANWVSIYYMKIEWSDSTLKITWCGIYCALNAPVKYEYKKLAPYIEQLLQWLKNLTKNLYNINIITDFCLFRELLRTRNKYVSINTQKMKLLPKVTQRYVFSKITFKTLSAMPHSQNSIFQLDMLLEFLPTR